MSRSIIEIALKKYGTPLYVIDEQTTISFISYCLTVGFMLGSFAVNVGHELTHRKNMRSVSAWAIQFAHETTFHE